MKRIFNGLAIVSAVVYVFAMYYLLFRFVGREMVIMSDHMLDNYNYWNTINLIPFKTIAEYITAIPTFREQAIRNLGGNLLLFFPAGFYLPFFVRRMDKVKIYSTTIAALIVSVEIVQLLTMRGSLDVDDFILNFVGTLMGLIFFTRTPVRALFNLRAW